MLLGCSAPEIVVVQLGSNDLTSMSAANTGSAIEDLARLLFECYGIKLVCVCQTIFPRDSPSFNKQVNLLTQYLKVVLEPLPYVIYWRHRGFWNCKNSLFCSRWCPFEFLKSIQILSQSEGGGIEMF